MKFTLHTPAVNGGPFNCRPAMAFELEAEKILCNDIAFPWENRVRGMYLWVVNNEFGAIGAVWAEHESDAMDELIDAGLGDSLLVDEETVANSSQDERESWAGLGNASEPCDLENVYCSKVEFDKVRDFNLIVALAEARGSGQNNLDA